MPVLAPALSLAVATICFTGSDGGGLAIEVYVDLALANSSFRIDGLTLVNNTAGVCKSVCKLPH
jgi:hypothetical protein